jgi:hypothetical protein
MYYLVLQRHRISAVFCLTISCLWSRPVKIKVIIIYILYTLEHDRTLHHIDLGYFFKTFFSYNFNMSYWRYLCLFAYSGLPLILCCVFALSVFVLCIVSCQFLWIVHFLSCRFQSIAEDTYRAICLRLYCIFSYQFVGSESCVRLLDVDGDGILDVLFSAATSQDISGVHWRYVCLFAYSGLPLILCCVFALSVFVLCIVSYMTKHTSLRFLHGTI